ncbi:pirin family protein [Tenacibaculum discolor]|uniref:Pirin family protein n=1 Tax=Tenacibaculum discolor TaxID=361581 RepID=A0A2G1BWY8_9FLAO|nr:pirin family protein [Tenacibaculum discolor]MDP2540591.1 pirin family protein [Tenacibaculum discolor]PHN98553.1 short-chain dehydrogenase [Tenacibaculum discolor]
MKTRSIEKIVKPGTPHFVGDGFRVHNFIPGTSTMQRMDPFIMLDYNSKYNFPPTDKPKGVGVHPHRGFETVTIAYKGRVEHGDSAGGGGIIGEGDVQWMTAASGVLHKEFHETEWSKTGGEFQMVQLWVNLPAKDKMSPPKYQAIANAEMAKIPLADGGGEIEVIAGEYKGNKGPASTFSPVNMFNVKLKKGVKTQLTFPEKYTTAILSVEGSVKVNESNNVLEDHFALFKNDGDTFTLEALEDAVILVLSGEPLNEPIAAHGPFVMNTKQELIEAFQDFNTGKFGYLED